jgi:protein-disulfide isomerase
METQQPTKQERWKLRQRERMQERINEQQQSRLKRVCRRTAFWLLVVLALGGGALGMTELASRRLEDKGPVITVDAITTEDWVKGNRDAKAVLIEYSDLQCPACAQYYPLLEKITEELGDKLAVAYRHFPLPNHRNAKPAAYAAEAAGRQGKFWEMHDIIFDNQDVWKDKRNAEEVFINYAQTLNLNVDQFKTDFASKEIRKMIDGAYQNAVGLRLNSTPTFFLNGKKLSSPRNYEAFRNIIIQAINENS